MTFSEGTMSLYGTWAIHSSPDFDESYLHMERPAFVTLHPDGHRIAGEYQVGLQSGNIDGRERPDGSITFSFEGNDEMDDVSGSGTAILEGDRLILTLAYYQGDDYVFEGRRPR